MFLSTKLRTICLKVDGSKLFLEAVCLSEGIEMLGYSFLLVWMLKF
jgi:hypothetical protein